MLPQQINPLSKQGTVGVWVVAATPAAREAGAFHPSPFQVPSFPFTIFLL